MASVLPRDKQTDIVSALAEGVSIRATEYLTGVHRLSLATALGVTDHI
ncbi:MAG: hypothetical protein Q7V31_08635 [Parvibaculum sp.]|nr:hypothetical protein [Parvibaculum sp.]MDO8838985.1 hypothetical protein [Parvibaculum sp.]